MAAIARKIPALRFPEFEGEWEEKRLEDISKGVMYGMNSAAIPFDGVNKYLRITDIDEESRAFVPNPLTSPEGKIEDKYKLKEGDIVFTRTGASTGKSYLFRETDGNLYFAGFLIKFSIIKSVPYFVYSSTFRSSYLKWVQVMSMRSGQPGINAEEYKSLKIALPPLPEQQKIATFLTTIDTRIQQLSRKKALLEQYKKGVIQQIFSQEIRFKDEEGKEFPEWEEKQLGAVFTFCQTNSLSRSLLNYERGAVKNIHYGDIHTKFPTIFDLSKEEVPFINESVDLSKIADENYCKVGDLIIADASEDYKDVGKAIEIVNLAGQTLLAGLHTLIVRDVKNQTVTGFKGYMMKTYNVRQQIMRLATGVSVLGISKGNLSKVKVPLPSLSEQQKIASFLSAIDRQINLVSQQLERMKTFKKGLLQQIFV